MRLEAGFDAVILKPIEEEETKFGNIVVPDLGKDKNQQAEVIAVGPGKYTVTGTFIKTVVEVGDIVVLPTMGASKFEFEGEDYIIIPETQILAFIRQ
jgi:chaperonin GroES